MSHLPELGIGLIGCGNIGGRAHAPAYARLPEARLVAVCDLLPERAADTAAQTRAATETDYRRLLERADVDVVDLCIPTAQHAELAIAALQAGKHVLCEKPIARSLAEADALIATARQSGLQVMIGHVRRFDPRYVEIHDCLANGDVGRPVYIRRAERQWLPFPPQAWFWKPALGGGVILDIGVHIADLLRWYYGCDPDSVYAVGRRVREAARQADSYDHALITYHFPDGALGLAEASWAYPPGFGAGFYGSLDVVGTAGKLQYSDQDSQPMLIFDSETGATFPRYFRFMSTTEQAFEAEIAHFLRCVLDDRPPRVSLEDARAALEMCLAAQRSADRGQPVPLPFEEEAYGENARDE
jgi:UDP-N-acetylglucosamine 3-dehydrogenase